MFAYLFKKALSLLISLFLIVTATFFLMHLIPGDPFIGENPIPEAVLLSLKKCYGLDKPLWQQYFYYLRSLFKGNLGVSIVYPGRPVFQFIADGFPISFRLGLQALFLAIPFGVFLGVVSAIWRTQWQDHLAILIATLGVSVPNFIFSSFLQYLFSMKLGLFPVARWGGFEHTVLPSLALSALPTAFIARLIRSSMIDVLHQEYIRAAKAKGLSLLQAALFHGLKNALLPVIAYLGPITTHILMGSFMVEKIFAIPGLGQWMIHSINSRDYPVILGLTLFFSAFLICMMFLIDLLYTVLDPRIQIQKTRGCL